MTGLMVTESAMQGRWPVVPATVSMLLLCATASGATQFEAPANREAAEILPAELLRGPKYQVRDTVVSYGYMHHWTVDSDFGTFEAIGDGVKPALLGVAVGLAAAWWASRLLTGLLYGVGPADLATFTIVPTALVLVAIAASALPAWRASRLDPTLVLRRD